MKSHEILAMFEKKRNKVDIMWDALGYMQSYNGRSPIECIGFAMGLTRAQVDDEEKI